MSVSNHKMKLMLSRAWPIMHAGLISSIIALFFNWIIMTKHNDLQKKGKVTNDRTKNYHIKACTSRTFQHCLLRSQKLNFCLA